MKILNFAILIFIISCSQQTESDKYRCYSTFREKYLKENKIEFKKGDTFSFEDNIFDYSEDKNVRKIAKLRKKMLKTLKPLQSQAP